MVNSYNLKFLSFFPHYDYDQGHAHNWQVNKHYDLNGVKKMIIT
jgi:hypothetical protein